MLKTFNFILTKLEILFDFIDQGIEEVKYTSVLEKEKLESTKKQILAFMNKFKFKCSKQLDTMMFQIFREQIDVSKLAELIEDRIVEENKSGDQWKGISS